jgi:hypothetical protein
MRPPSHSQSNGLQIELATESKATEAAELSRSRAHNGTPGLIISTASYLILAIGIGTVAAAAYLMVASYTPVPYWDEWGVLTPYLGSNSLLPLQWIWAQTNEHRIVFYKLLLLANLHFFKGREWPMFLAIFLSQLSLCGLLAWFLRKLGKLEGWAYRTAIGIALYCVFCPSQWENYIWGFQLSFVLVSLLFVSALLALLALGEPAGLPRNKQRALLGISILAAAAATISNANGVLAWPILIAASLMLRLRRSITAAYVVSGAVLVGLYFHGYVAPHHHASPVASLHQPLQIVEYVEKYFGSSFVPTSHLDWSLQLGAVGLMLVFGMSLWIVCHLDTNDRVFSIGLFSLTGYMFLTACVTALGRINFGTDQAFSPRYQSYALLFWFAFGVLIMKFLLARHRLWTLAVLSVAIVTLLAASIHWYGPILQIVGGKASERRLGGMALVTGVHDDDFLQRAIWISPPMLWDDATYLKQHGLSVFSTDEAQQLNQPLASVYKVVPSDRCFGSIDRVQSFQQTSGGLELEGWAVHSKSKRPLSGIVMVTDGMISGYGAPGIERPDVANSLRSYRALLSGWMGFVEPAARGNATEVYGVINSFGHHNLCKIGQAAPPEE